MNRSPFVAILALIVLAVAAFLVWQHVSGLDTQIQELSRQVNRLGGQLAAAEDRAAEAEAGADRARQAAGEAADRAVEALEREEESAEEAKLAEAAREEALKREKQAAAEREKARVKAQEEERARLAAEEEKAAAETLRQEEARRAAAAETEARRARAETEKVRQRLELELDRMERALGKIADTRRTALGVVMTLDSQQIEFDFDRAELRPENREVLSRIAGVMLTFDNYGIQIFGHTDDVGSEEYNQELSELRAGAVREYLVEAGIAPEAMSTMGLGKSSPLVEGTDPESRQRNRRVELAIVFSEGDIGSTVEEGQEGGDA